MKNFLINASNLHVGGGIQVATSLIEELSLLKSSEFKISVIASDEVNLNLLKLKTNLNSFDRYEVFNSYGISTFISGLYKKITNYDVVLTVFGPLYTKRLCGKSIVGFAQPWIIYPNNEIYNKFSILKKASTSLKLKVQKFFFAKHDKLVVELPHVRKGIIDGGISTQAKVSVIHNSLSSLYFDPNKWDDLLFNIAKKNFSIGFVGRDYPHKNTSIIPHIKKILLDNYGLTVDFYVTFNEQEWEGKDNFFRNNVINVGALNVNQCPHFYQSMNGIIFPSLLECFSATPLEALVMERPLFASDRNFVRDVCASHAYYFNPLDPEDASNVIAKYINQNQSDEKKYLIDAKYYATNFSNAKQRALDYFNLMIAVSSGG